VLTKTLGNLDRQEAPLRALARLIYPLVPVDKGVKDAAETAVPSLSHIIFSRETCVAEGRTGQALTAERRPMSLGTHDSRRAHMRVEGDQQVLAHRD